jgi:hypothetical protein
VPEHVGKEAFFMADRPSFRHPPREILTYVEHTFDHVTMQEPWLENSIATGLVASPQAN